MKNIVDQVKMLIKCPGSRDLADRLIEKSGIDHVDVESKVFPDGESYVRLDGDVEGEDCFIVQTTYPDRHLLELFFIQDALMENGASTIHTIVPYYSYARQDQIFEEGEGISARAIAERIQIQSDSFYSIDLHSEKITDFFDIPAQNLSAMRLLSDHSMIHDPDILISPDEGGIERIKVAADEVDLEWDHLEKTRIDGQNVEMEPKNLAVEGKKIVILDDIISTGGTMKEACGELKRLGAEEVYAGCTHGLFVGDGLQELKEEFDGVFCSDTIENERNEVTVAPLLEDIIY